MTICLYNNDELQETVTSTNQLATYWTTTYKKCSWQDQFNSISLHVRKSEPRNGWHLFPSNRTSAASNPIIDIAFKFEWVCYGIKLCWNYSGSVAPNGRIVWPHQLYLATPHSITAIGVYVSFKTYTWLHIDENPTKWSKSANIERKLPDVDIMARALNLHVWILVQSSMIWVDHFTCHLHNILPSREWSW